MSLRHVLLGLLNQDRRAGTSWPGDSIAPSGAMAWHAQYSQIYPELYRMAALGLITVVAGASTPARLLDNPSRPGRAPPVAKAGILYRPSD